MSSGDRAPHFPATTTHTHDHPCSPRPSCCPLPGLARMSPQHSMEEVCQFLQQMGCVAVASLHSPPAASREGSLTSWWQLTDGLTLQERLVLGQGGLSGGVGGIKEKPGTSDMSQRRRA